MIPIANLYYLLCYAWNTLDEKDLIDVTGIESTELVDLFARVLIGGANRLIKDGLDRGYQQFSADIPSIRGPKKPLKKPKPVSF